MDEARATAARHLQIHGRVQRVGYRAFARRAARRLGLTGWVRNRPDGTVELVAQGPESALDALLLRLRQGPPGAHVSEIREEPESPRPDRVDFEITYV
jgi:acylphosphatase